MNEWFGKSEQEKGFNEVHFDQGGFSRNAYMLIYTRIDFLVKREQPVSRWVNR